MGEFWYVRSGLIFIVASSAALALFYKAPQIVAAVLEVI